MADGEDRLGVGEEIAPIKVPAIDRIALTNKEVVELQDGNDESQV